jgi:hypothetical protein
VRAIHRVWERLWLGWQDGLRVLPFFTQRTAVLLLGVLVATLALLGGVVALVGWPGAATGPTRLVPGERAGQAPVSRPEPGGRPAAGTSEGGVRSGADAGGAAAASPSSTDAARSAPAGGAGAGRAAPGEGPGGAPPGEGPGGAAAGAGGSGGAAGAGAGGPPAAPPTTSPPPATTSPGPLDPVEELLGPLVDTPLP